MNSSSTTDQTVTPESNSPPPTLSQTTVTLPLTLVAGLLETAGHYVNQQRELKQLTELFRERASLLQGRQLELEKCYGEIRELQRMNVEWQERVNELEQVVDPVEFVMFKTKCGRTRAKKALQLSCGKIKVAVLRVEGWQKR